jgi:hypothetical protein
MSFDLRSFLAVEGHITKPAGHVALCGEVEVHTLK